jgi:hypothetical protein
MKNDRISINLRGLGPHIPICNEDIAAMLSRLCRNYNQFFSPAQSDEGLQAQTRFLKEITHSWVSVFHSKFWG